MYRPSWEVRPSLEPSPETPESSPPAGEERQPLREEPLTQTPSTNGVPAAAPAAASNRYVLLASIWEFGTAPSSLETSNGLLALAVPVNSRLADLLKKGQTYRFQSDDYTANYECLEVFATPDEAFASYPEGMQVSAAPRTFLRWREPTEAAALSAANWAAPN
jgi:hypothetical protein